MSSSAAGVASSSSPSAAAAVAAAAASASPSSVPTSTQFVKLDGVLYHFYAKTSALIATARLTHFEGVAQPELIPVGQETTRSGSSSDPNQEDKGEGSSTRGPSQSASKRSSKWFAVETFDNDIFRDELRLWRSISQLIPSEALEAAKGDAISSGPVPTLVLDVVLDVSDLGDEHVLILTKVDDEGGHRGGRSTSSGRSRRIAVSGKCSRDRNDESAREHRHVLLERWKLDFEPAQVIPAPELPAFYKRSVLHFREVFKLLHELPSQALYERYTAPASVAGQGVRASASQGQLKLGVRLGAGPVWDQEDPSILSFAESLDPEVEADDRDLSTEQLPPIATGIGHLKASVQYRHHAEFSVDDAEALAGLQDLSMEEDYFKPTMAKHMAKAGSAASGAVPISSNTALRSLLSATADRKPSPIMTSGTPPSLAARSTATGSHSMSPTQELLSRSPGPSPSVFSTSASGRPVAGLSSLRSGVSAVAAPGTSPITTRTPLISTTAPGGQPTVPSPSHEGAAFVAHGRRPSMSDRRARDLSGTSLEKSSPPSPTRAAMPTQIGPQTSSSLRPTNQRTASVLTALRSGSYSPSSPSPLAQQLSSQGGTSDTGLASPSSSFRGLASASSLRGVFSSYSPAASQGSLLSLSRTPPRAYAGSPSTASLAGGDVDASASVPRSLPVSSTSSSRRRLSSLSGEIGAEELGAEPASAGLPGQHGVPTVAPRPISRYPSTFSYRHARQQGSLDGSATAGSLDAAQGEDEFSLYSRSWQARIEQRRMYASGRGGLMTLPSSPSLSQQQSLRGEVSPRIGFAPRSLGDGSRGGYSSSLRAGSQGSTNTREDLDDLVRMIDLRAGESVQGGLGSGRSMLGTRLENRRAGEVQVQPHGTGATGTTPSEAEESSPPLRGQPLSRSQVDDLLSRMAMSVNQPGLGASAGATGQAREGSVSGSPSSLRGYPPQREGSFRRTSRVSGGRTSTLEPIPAGSPMGGLGGLPFARRMASSSLGNADSESPAMSSVGERSDREGQSASGGSAEASAAALPSPRPDSSEAIGGDDTTTQSGTVGASDSDSSSRLGVTRDSAGAGSRQAQRALRRTSGSLEIFPHDDVTFDEAEDGAAGRMELSPADHHHSSGSRTDEARIEGGLGALGAPRPMVGPALVRRGLSHEVDDAEEQLARFGADLANNASNRGRGSHSPWRTRNVTPGGGGGGSGGGGGGGGGGSPSSHLAPNPRPRLEYPEY